MKILNIIFYSTIVLVIIILFSCKDKEKEKIIYSLESIGIHQSFDLSTIIKEDWDTLYIISPYEELDSIVGINFSERDKSSLMISTSYEGYTTFAFIKNRQMVNYHRIPYTAVDFFPLIDSINYFSPKQKFILDEKRVVSLVE
ncbi:hypothetical protein [Dysgonomonas macrotermitis]|uniref:Uncharacterized protein n=1 Tax=Dysgonomonas macrotermitis TaxID=1346286 RepID=A0A1M5FQ18_9BACT|nr:hypothetical protein [Dysgonomonas macrotermitis]SHF93595.1 hypothetical protein SAMN05444362_11274 [Dysgonomonas macrotermitis]